MLVDRWSMLEGFGRFMSSLSITRHLVVGVALNPQLSVVAPSDLRGDKFGGGGVVG